jgi:flagellar hook-associated protein 1
MVNFSQKIINNAISSLRAQQALIATTGNNIANVNTEGYARRTINLEAYQTRSNSIGPNVGNGVRISSVRRTADDFIQKLLVTAAGDREAAVFDKGFIDRIQQLYDLTGERATIGSSLTEFFSAINDLRTAPESIELRSVVIEKADRLVTSIKDTYDQLANFQEELNSRLSDEILTVSEVTEEIAALNGQIILKEKTGGVAADERDKREMLLQRLSEKISFNVSENDDGSILVFMDNGFPIVFRETSRKLEVTSNPSFATGPMPPSLSGRVLNHIVFDFDPSTAVQSHVDFTQALAQGGGTVGAMLRLRGYNDVSNTSAFQATGELVDLASRVEALARSLLTSFNREYLGPDEDGGTAGLQPSAADLTGTVPSVYGLFDFQFTGAKDSNADGDPNDIGTHAGVDSYATRLQLAFTDPRRLAAARDTDAAAGATAFQVGNGDNLEAIYGLRSTQFTHATGSYSLTATFEDAYGEMVTYVSNRKIAADIRETSAMSIYEGIANRRDEISAVSLDEEFSKLIFHQKAYEASARMIQISKQLLDEVIQLI